MTYQTYEEILDEAITEAERFIKKAKLAIEEPSHSVVHKAAVKRASMDLTRVLVDVRGRRRY